MPRPKSIPTLRPKNVGIFKCQFTLYSGSQKMKSINIFKIISDNKNPEMNVDNAPV